MEKKEMQKVEVPKLHCGIVMPISEIDGCTELHWKEVNAIVSQSIDKAGFIPNLVSNSDDVGVIQKRIIQNLYDNPIVVVDVSGKNPNVMFELGIRLAFDKPTIIIKDDKTHYSFDTSPIEHIDYPRDLRFTKIVDFKEKLTEKIIQTHKKATTDENYSTFLKHFGSFKIAKIKTEEVTKEDIILDEIKNLREYIGRTNRVFSKRDESYEKPIREYYPKEKNDIITMCLGETDPKEIDPILKQIKTLSGIESAELEILSNDHRHIEIKINRELPKRVVIKKLEKIARDKVAYID